MEPLSDKYLTIRVFEYTNADLLVKLSQKSGHDIDRDNRKNSVTLEEERVFSCNGASNGFDENLTTAWMVAQKAGLFRYKYNENAPYKILSEKFQFIAQLNPDRASKRRKPQEMSSLSQPFNLSEFNFNKVNTQEMVMTLKPAQRTDSAEHLILINVSPLEYGHILLVPSLTRNEPQRVTLDGLRLALEMILLSRSSDFRVGFNSLCGHASVNHHHYHGYYLKHRLYIEHAELKPLTGPCWEFCDESYPAPGFVFLLGSESSTEMETFLSDAYTLISHLQENDVAHNIYISRGSLQNQVGHFDSIRLFVWARASTYGSKVCEEFNPALAELAGHFPIKSETSYMTLTEEVLSNELREVCLETFTAVRSSVLSLFTNLKDTCCASGEINGSNS